MIVVKVMYCQGLVHRKLIIFIIIIWNITMPVRPNKEQAGLFFFFKATPVAYGGSQARGQIGATASGLHHSHSNARSMPRLRPTPELTATPVP